MTAINNTILIIYGSTTGNTAKLASYLEQSLRTEGHSVHLLEVTEVKPQILNKYQFALLGASTWGAAQLQDDFYDFDLGMANLDLAHLKAAAFGTGGESWPLPCDAVYQIEERLKKCNALLVLPALAISDDVGAEKHRAEAWAKDFSTKIS